MIMFEDLIPVGEPKGMFDDLVPPDAPAAPATAGMFDDLVPAPAVQPEPAPKPPDFSHKISDFWSKGTLTAALPVSAKPSNVEPAIATLDRTKYFLDPIPQVATQRSQSGMVAGALDWGAGFDKDLYNERKRVSESNLASAIERAEKAFGDAEALKARADAGEKITRAEADATNARGAFEHERYRIADAEHDAISKADAPLWRSFAANAAKGGLSTAAAVVDAANSAREQYTGFMSREVRDTKNFLKDSLESVTGIHMEREQAPPAVDHGRGLADDLRASTTQAGDFYSANPEAQNAGAQIGRAGGSFLAMTPTLAMGGMGLPAAVGQMAGMTYEDAYTQKEQELIATGGMSAAAIDEAAQEYASGEAVKALPHLAVFMAGGKLATVGVGRVMRNSSTLARTSAGFVAGTAANVAVGGGFRLHEKHKAKKEIEGKLDEKFPGWRDRAGDARSPEESEMLAQREAIPGFMPTIEQFTTDALWGGVHAKGEYVKGKQLDGARDILSGKNKTAETLKRVVANPDSTDADRYLAAVQLDAMTKGANNLLTPLKNGEAHEADPVLAELFEKAKAEEAAKQAKKKAKEDAKAKAPTVLSNPANDSTKLSLSTPPAAPVYGVKPVVPEISNAEPKPAPIAETESLPAVPPPAPGVQLPAAKGDADIPELPTHLAEAIAAENAPDVNRDHVRRHFGEGAAQGAQSTKPSESQLKVLANARAHAESSGWDWNDVIEKARQQLGLDADFLKPKSHEAGMLEAMRVSGAKAEERRKLTENQWAEDQARLDSENRRKADDVAASKSAADEKLKAKNKADAESLAKMHNDIVAGLKPDTITLWRESKTKKAKKDLLSAIMLRSGTRNDAALRDALDRAAQLPAADVAKPEPVEPPSTAMAAKSHGGVPFREAEVPLSEITLSEDVPNVKEGADTKTGVVPGEELSGDYKRAGTAPIVLWERLDGKKEVITGRHRRHLAITAGEKTIPAQIFREADGFTKEMALTFDAEANILDGQGKISDYANYFRHTETTAEEASRRGLLARDKGRKGFAIGKDASNDLYALYRAGKISDAKAAAIAQSAPGDEAAQRVGIKYALAGHPVAFIENVIKAAKSGASERGETLDLFGNDDSAMVQMEKRADTATKIQQGIRDKINSARGAVKRPDSAAEMGVDVKDIEGTRGTLAELEAELRRWENWPMHRDLMDRVKAEEAGGPAPKAVAPEPAPVVEAAKSPKLRSGEKQGSLLDEQAFNLAGETAVDGERVTREKAEAERKAAEVKADADKRQMELPATKKRIREDSPEAAPIIREIDALIAEAERRHAGMSEGQTRDITQPVDLLTSKEKARLHDLQNQIRPKSQAEAAADVAAKRNPAATTNPSQTGSKLVDGKKHAAIYNGKEIEADSFKSAAQRVSDNLKSGEHGYVRSPDGQLHEISRDKKSAVKVSEMRSKEQREIDAVKERIANAKSPQEKKSLSERLAELESEKPDAPEPLPVPDLADGYSAWRGDVAKRFAPRATDNEISDFRLVLGEAISKENAAPGVDQWQHPIIAHQVASDFLAGKRPDIEAAWHQKNKETAEAIAANTFTRPGQDMEQPWNENSGRAPSSKERDARLAQIQEIISRTEANMDRPNATKAQKKQGMALIAALEKARTGIREKPAAPEPAKTPEPTGAEGGDERDASADKKRSRLVKLIGQPAIDAIEKLRNWGDHFKSESYYDIRLTADLGLGSHLSPSARTKLIDAMIAGTPTIIDDIIALKPISKKRLVKEGIDADFIRNHGYESNGEGVYLHPNAASESATKPVNPAQSSEPVRDASKPEQMTPEEFVGPKLRPMEDEGGAKKKFEALIGTKAEADKTITYRAALSALEYATSENKLRRDANERDRGLWDRKHREAILDARDEGKPVSAAAVDAYGIKLPEGYVKRGELYVYEASEPAAKPAEPAPEAVKPDVAPNGMPIGPGKMTAGELPDRETFEIKNASVEARQEREGRAKLYEKARRKMPEVWEEVERLLEEKPQAANALVDAIETIPNRGMTDTEQGMLLWRVVTMQNSRHEAAVRAKDFDQQSRKPGISAEERIELETQAAWHSHEADMAEREIIRTEDAARKAGTSQARAFNMRKFSIYDDFDIAPMEAALRVKKGAPLTEAEIESIAKESKAYKEVEKQRDDADARATEAKEEAALNRAAADEIKKYAPGFLNRVSKWIETKEAEIPQGREKAKALINKIMGRTNIGAFNAVEIAQLTKIFVNEAAVFIARKGVDFAKWSSDMAGEFGDSASHLFKPAWDKANAEADGTKVEKKPKAEKPKTPKQKAEKEKADTEAAGTIEGIKAVVGEVRAKGGNPALDDVSNYINRLAKEFIEGGETTVAGVLGKLHEAMEPIIGKSTDKDMLIAWRKYGKGEPATTDPLKKLIANINEEALLTAKIKVLEDNEKLEATGNKRPESREEARQLRAKLGELKRQMPGGNEKSPNQLSSILDAMMTRAENRIKDLKFEIARGERVVKTKTPAPTSMKLEALKAELAKVEAEHDAMFPRPAMTPEQRLGAAITASERAATKAEAELAEARKGNFSKVKKNGTFSDPKIEAARARAATARAETNALKNAGKPNTAESDKAQAALNRALVDQERWSQMLSGEATKGVPLTKEALTQMEEDARTEIAAMRQLAADLRAEAKPKADPEARKENAAVAALEKAAAEYERRMNAADFSGKAKIHTADTLRKAAAKAAKNAAKAAHDAAKKAWEVTHPQKAIDARIAQMERMKADIEGRDARGDYTRKTRKAPVDISSDPAAVALEADLNEIKARFKGKLDAAQREREWKAKNWAEKGLHGLVLGKEAFQNLKLNFDASGFAQAFGGWLTSPIRGTAVMARGTAVLAMSAFSEKYARKVEAQIQRSKYAQDGLYKRLGLDLKFEGEHHEHMQSILERMADIDVRLSKMGGVLGIGTAGFGEGAAHIGKILPKILGRGIRASNLSFKTMVNGMRSLLADKVLSSYERAGVDVHAMETESLARIGNAINAFTGSGSLPSTNSVLQKVWFAPNWTVSVMKLVTGQPLLRTIPASFSSGKKGEEARQSMQTIAGMYLRAAVTYAGILAARHALFGDEDDDNKLSLSWADFNPSNLLDPRAGSIRLESGVGFGLTAGRARVASMIVRGAMGKGKDAYGVMQPENTLETILHFMAGKLSQDIHLGIMALSGLQDKGLRNFKNESITVPQMFGEVLLPLSTRNLEQVIKAEGIKRSTILAVGNMYMNALETNKKRMEFKEWEKKRKAAQ